MTRTRLVVLGVAVAASIIAIGSAVSAQTVQRFDDVPEGHYAYDAIEWAAANGITGGCGDGARFCPEQTLNRAHMVTFLHRFSDKVAICRTYTASGYGSQVNEPLPGWVLTPGVYRSTVSFDIDGDRPYMQEVNATLIASSLRGGDAAVYSGSLFSDIEGEEGPNVYVSLNAAPEQDQNEVTAGQVKLRINAIGRDVLWTVTLEGAC